MNIKHIILGVLIFAVSACSNLRHHDNYLSKSQSIVPIRTPVGSPATQGENYYPVPRAANLTPQVPMSLEPPGNNFNRYRKGRVKGKKMVSFSRNKEHLVVAEQIDYVWQKMGNGIRFYKQALIQQ